jgi:Family of unknown function (DUF6510)
MKAYESLPDDINRSLMLDGNAVAGTLYEIFSSEMTTSLTECVNCGRQGEFGSLLAFTQAPGIVLRCQTCEHIVLRIVKASQAIYLDARGAMFIRLER